MAIIDTSNLDQSIPQPDIIAAQDKQFVKYPAGTYTVENPHPGFGKDPNIINEYGHTVYPKYVKDVNGADVIANNEEEEARITGKHVEPNQAPDPAKGWSA